PDGQRNDDLRLRGRGDRAGPLIGRQVPRRVPPSHRPEPLPRRTGSLEAAAAGARMSDKAPITPGAGGAQSGPAAGAPPPPPRPAPSKDTYTVLFDGNPIEVPKNVNLIEAAKLAGIEIPHFCFHPRLSVVGQCRMCLVEIEGVPKIQAACTTPLKDGLKVITKSQKVVQSRAANMEFLLINHPLDCPICDQAGECKLQDNSFGYGDQRSRYDERKRQYAGFDRTMIGPHVIADMTRCIQCTRCIRFCQEIAGTGELTFLDRGGRTL